MITLDHKADTALRYIHDFRPDLASPLIDDLLAADYPTAHYIEGAMFRKGGIGLAVDMERAIDCFRKQAIRTPTPSSFLFLARLMIEEGDVHRTEALEWIEAAAMNWRTPDIDVAYGLYHQHGDPPNLDLARHHYWKAFRRGRLTGLHGLVQIRRSLGQTWRPALIGLAGCLLVLPLFVLLFGNRTRRPI